MPQDIREINGKTLGPAYAGSIWQEATGEKNPARAGFEIR
jgi:hypothetical protein